MKIRTPVPEKKSRLEIIPLIDIMFFLLASFMMVTLQMQIVRTVKSNLPTATLATPSKKPDIVFFGGMDAVAGPMIRQMKQLGMTPKFMGGDGICSGELPKLAGGATLEAA